MSLNIYINRDSDDLVTCAVMEPRRTQRRTEQGIVVVLDASEQDVLESGRTGQGREGEFSGELDGIGRVNQGIQCYIPSGIDDEESIVQHQAEMHRPVLRIKKFDLQVP